MNDGEQGDAQVNEDITRVLRGFSDNDNSADELLELVYAQLRDIAQMRMGREQPGHSLQATALVHEAYLKVLGGDAQTWDDRGHFFRAASEAMRRILIDHARKKRSTKRGGERSRLPITVLDLASDYDADGILALNDALDDLAREDPKAAEVVQLRFFGGLDVVETALTMGVSERTVARDWAFARARLFALLSEEGS